VNRAARGVLAVSASLALLLALLSMGCRPAPAEVEPVTGMRFVRIEPGSFTMGSPAEEPGHRPDETQHRVTITRAFLMSTTEVTQQQWTRVMGSNPSHFQGNPSAPVEQVTWNDVHEFLRRLNARGNGTFRLPTEAEWEYACRAGSQRPYAFGDRLSSSRANYDARYPLAGEAQGPYRGRTTPAGTFQPNTWGLYDMHGNVWEWCEDDYCPYAASATDPLTRCGGRLQVIRGGSWYFDADSARSALRYTHAANLKGFSIGFRVVRVVR
jgi:formylglycine-generating enzyme required for sulfatase activity